MKSFMNSKSIFKIWIATLLIITFLTCASKKENNNQEELVVASLLYNATTNNTSNATPQASFVSITPVDVSSVGQDVIFTKVQYRLVCSSAYGDSSITYYMAIIRINASVGNKLIITSTTTNLDNYFKPVSLFHIVLQQGSPKLTVWVDPCKNDPQPYTNTSTSSVSLQDVPYTGNSNTGTYSFTKADNYFIQLQVYETYPTDLKVRLE